MKRIGWAEKIYFNLWAHLTNLLFVEKCYYWLNDFLFVFIEPAFVVLINHLIKAVLVYENVFKLEWNKPQSLFLSRNLFLSLFCNATNHDCSLIEDSSFRMRTTCKILETTIKQWVPDVILLFLVFLFYEFIVLCNKKR